MVDLLGSCLGAIMLSKCITARAFTAYNRSLSPARTRSASTTRSPLSNNTLVARQWDVDPTYAIVDPADLEPSEPFEIALKVFRTSASVKSFYVKGTMDGQSFTFTPDTDTGWTWVTDRTFEPTRYVQSMRNPYLNAQLPAMLRERYRSSTTRDLSNLGSFAYQGAILTGDIDYGSLCFEGQCSLQLFGSVWNKPEFLYHAPPSGVLGLANPHMIETPDSWVTQFLTRGYTGFSLCHHGGTGYFAVFAVAPPMRYVSGSRVDLDVLPGHGAAWAVGIRGIQLRYPQDAPAWPENLPSDAYAIVSTTMEYILLPGTTFYQLAEVSQS